MKFVKCECGLPLPPARRPEAEMICPCGHMYRVGHAGWGYVTTVEGYPAHKAGHLGPSDCTCASCVRATVEDVWLEPTIDEFPVYAVKLSVHDEQGGITVLASPEWDDYEPEDLLLGARIDVTLDPDPAIRDAPMIQQIEKAEQQ